MNCNQNSQNDHCSNLEKQNKKNLKVELIGSNSYGIQFINDTFGMKKNDGVLHKLFHLIFSNSMYGIFNAFSM